MVITYESKGYNVLRKTEYIHFSGDIKEFVDDFVYTNNIEPFWAIIKRGVYGILVTLYSAKEISSFAFRINYHYRSTIDFSKE